MRRILLAVALAAPAGLPEPAAAGSEAPAWVSRDVSPDARRGHGMAYDARRGRLVLFGGIAGAGPVADTWEWDGSTWLRRPLPAAPPARFYPVLVYDERREVIVLFGGIRDGVPLDDTWEYDGTAWTERVPLLSPPARSGHAMTYDAARGRVVLFGGVTGELGSMNDTWEYDGTTWLPVGPVGLLNPGTRSFHAMAYDRDRARTVLFGGYSGPGGGGYLSDTWEWNGTTWARVPTAAAPRRRAWSAMAYDPVRRETVLFGGDVGAFEPYQSDTWALDGTTWTQRQPAGSPVLRSQHAMAWDPVRGRVVMVGGEEGFLRALLRDTWEWDGTAWIERTPDPAPPGRSGHGLVHDEARGRSVLFGGLRKGLPKSTLQLMADTWEWDGVSWQQRETGFAPSARSHMAMAYDPVRDVTVVFGGTGAAGTLGDTWEWDGSGWLERTPAGGPPPRRDGAMAFDPANERLLLFGGSVGANLLADTWAWDGDRWLELTPAPSPSGRWGHALATDTARGEVVLFGGYGSGQRGDTWTWNGDAWEERAPATAPAGRYGHAMAEDPGRGRVLLVSGCCPTSFGAETWAWDGETWTSLPSGFPERSEPALSYDGARDRAVLFSGLQQWGAASDSWELVPAGS